ncbi:MAG: DNA polymerase III subunit gamma/tau [Veillonellaceae bacterium]|nr:DNA polymerase III subunit gamma/tau [Veillonellaceae bacterium]
MAYLALYRKWRPQIFADVIGQDHVARTLARAVETGKVAHAYLFSGPRGTGKTSMAKILAKALNCVEGPTAAPCNHCARCREINEGSAFDVLEIDAASNRGIDEIRALRDTVAVLPVAARHKVYIIDEAHMLTKEAANALLKTLEEPPEYAVFILATTEPERLPVTIISRCQRYEFRRISVASIAAHLLRIAERSEFSLTEEAAQLIAVRADGGLRDALSLLDQCIGMAEETVTAERVGELLGLPKKERMLLLAEAIVDRDGAAALAELADVLQSGREIEPVLRELLQVLRDALVYGIDPHWPELVVYGDELPRLAKLARTATPGRLSELARLLEDGIRVGGAGISPRLQTEMTLLRLCRAGGEVTGEDLEARLTVLENRPQAVTGEHTTELRRRLTMLESELAQIRETLRQQTAAPESRRAASGDSRRATAASANGAATRSGAAAQKKPARVAPPAPRAAETASATPPVRKKAAAETQPEAETETDAGGFFLAPAGYANLWQQVVDALFKEQAMAESSCYRNAELLLVEGVRAVIMIPHDFLVDAANKPAYREKVNALLLGLTGVALQVQAVKRNSREEAEARARAGALGERTAPAEGTNAQRTGTQDVAAAANAEMPPAGSEELPVAVSAEASENGAADPVAGEYQPVAAADIPADDRANPTLAKALEYLGDCDIYMRKE